MSDFFVFQNDSEIKLVYLNFSIFHFMKTKTTIRSLIINSLIYLVLIVVYLAVDTTFPGVSGGLPIPEMSEFVLLGIAVFSLIAFVVTLIRFFVIDNISPVGFIIHGVVFIGFVVNTVIHINSY